MNISEISWGDDSAELDPNLSQYFVSSAAYTRLLTATKSLVIGRKGAGKSALRTSLEDHFKKQPNSHIINISPSYGAVNAIMKNTEIQSQFGTEIFFEHTWLRQILLDALCTIGNSTKGRYAKNSEQFARDISIQMNRTTLDFLENITEVLGKLKFHVGELGEYGAIIEKNLRDIADADSLEHHVVELAKSGAKMYVFIDDLDLGWDNSTTSNNFLLGLLKASLYLKGLSKNIHCFIFLRADVYSILMSGTQHSDKYRNVERIRWSKETLKEMLEKRINHNRQEQGFPPLEKAFDSVFPSTVGTTYTDNWLVERTLSRPRELLQLARFYTEALTTTAPNSETLKEVEEEYSEWKLQDLCTEYSNQYPGLGTLFQIWVENYTRTKYTLTREELDERAQKIFSEARSNHKWFQNLVKKRTQPLS